MPVSTVAQRAKDLAFMLAIPCTVGDPEPIVAALEQMTPKDPYSGYSKERAIAVWLHRRRREVPIDEALLFSGRRWLWWLTDLQLTDLVQKVVALFPSDEWALDSENS